LEFQIAKQTALDGFVSEEERSEQRP